MAEEIIDGTGSGQKARVDRNNSLHVFAVTESERRQATEKGNEYNINTGLIPLTGTTESSVIYFSNNEVEDYVIEGLVFGLGVRSITVTDNALLTIIRNPDGGDIISDATNVDINSNANMGSAKTLKTTTLAYKGKDSGTITGGNDHAIIMIPEGRSFAPLNIELPRGASIGAKIDLNTSGGANFYMAIVGYVKDINNFE